MGVPVIRMRFVPSGNTLTPSAMRCSSSSASSLAFCAQRAGSSRGDLGHEQAIFARNGNAVFSFRGIEDAGERTTHSCHGFPGPCRGFATFHDCLPCSIPLRAKAASHPWGHAHMRPSRSVSNNYHATNHQPIRNKGAKKKRRATVQNGGRVAGTRALPRLQGIWGMRFGCRMTTGQNPSSNEALLCMASV